MEEAGSWLREAMCISVETTSRFSLGIKDFMG